MFISGWRVMAAAIAILAPLLFLRAPVVAADAWQPWGDGLPSFAPVITLGAAPEESGILWAGINDRPGLWFLSGEDQTWRPVPGSPPTYAFLWDARRQTWWAGTAEGLLLRPTGSTHWQADPSLTGPVFGLAMDDSERLYAVLGQQGLVASSAAADPAGTWVTLYEEPQAVSIAISAGGSDLYLGTAGHGLWVSHDGGGEWGQVQEIGDDYITSVRIVPQHDAVVACGNTRLYHSLDRGHTWAPIPALPVRPLGLALAPDGELFVGLSGAIARSGDAGLTWTLGGEGLPVGATIVDIAISHVEDSAVEYALYVVAGDGVYRSHDGGQTWLRHDAGLGGPQVSSLASDGSGGLVAATRMGLYRRPAGEDTWELVGPDFRYKRIYSLARHDATGWLYAGTQDGLLRSLDGGASWEDATSELTAHGVWGVMVDRADPQHLYIRLAYERIYESLDGGKTWTAWWEGME
ncbi:MAG: WD40/YVTN/BNR-like repeat-containing protein, partial [Anaerolineae bacterium]